MDMNKSIEEERKVVVIPVKKILVRSCEAAELMSVSPRTMSNLVASGKMPVVKIGSCTRYRVRDLYQFANANVRGVI